MRCCQSGTHQRDPGCVRPVPVTRLDGAGGGGFVAVRPYAMAVRLNLFDGYAASVGIYLAVAQVINHDTDGVPVHRQSEERPCDKRR